MRKSATFTLAAVEKPREELHVQKKVNTETIARMLTLLEKSGFHEVEVEEGEFRIKVVKSPRISRHVASNVPQEREEDCFIVKSPLVGTFFRGTSPEAKPFVEVGNTVATGQVICIIEAMKLMNEVEAKEGGKIVAILVENGTPVEYGEPLFKIKPFI